MRTAEAGGICVLALLLGGLLTVRAGWTPGAAEHDKERSGEDQHVHGAIPGLTATGATVDVEGVRLTLRSSTWPVPALRDVIFEVRLEPEGMSGRFEDGTIAFTMDMPMGDQRYRLVERAPGLWTAAVMLPTCPSGASRWTAAVEGRLDDRPFRAAYAFNLGEPAGAGR